MWQAETERWGDWETYHEALIQYEMAVRRAKRCSLRNCSGLMEVCETSRLVKICSLDCVRTAEGELSSLPDVVLRTLAATHFLVSGWIMHSWRVVEFPLQGDQNHQTTKAECQRPSHMERSCGQSEGYSNLKGTMEFGSVWLQTGFETILTPLCSLFRALIEKFWSGR